MSNFHYCAALYIADRCGIVCHVKTIVIFVVFGNMPFFTCSLWWHDLELLSVNWFCISVFGEFKNYFGIHNLCSVCLIKIFIFVQKIAYISKKIQWFCWQGIWLMVLVVHADNQTLQKNNSWLLCSLKKMKMECEERYPWVSNMFTIWFVCQNVQLFLVHCNLLT